jgi:hypothetical protein
MIIFLVNSHIKSDNYKEEWEEQVVCDATVFLFFFRLEGVLYGILYIKGE